MNSPDTPHREHADRRGYETRDVKWPIIAWLGLAVVLLTVFSQIGLWFLLESYRGTSA